MRKAILVSVLLTAACGGAGDNPDTNPRGATFVGSCTCAGEKGKVCFDYTPQHYDICKSGSACGYDTACSQETCGTTLAGVWSTSRCSVGPCCVVPNMDSSTCWGTSDSVLLDSQKAICSSAGGTWK